MSYPSPETIRLARLPQRPNDERRDIPDEPGVFFICAPQPEEPKPVFIGSSTNSVRVRVGAQQSWIKCRRFEGLVVHWLSPDDPLFPYALADKERFKEALIKYWEPPMNKRYNPRPCW